MPTDVSTILSLLGSFGLIGLSIVVIKMFTSKTKVTLIDKDTKYKLKLIEKKILNHDTRIFKFELPSPKHILGLPIGKHVYLSANINGSLVVRPYTPVTEADAEGYMELLIKVYFKNTHPKFPDGGKMTQYLNQLEIGGYIDVRGPNGLLEYKGNGDFLIQKDKKSPAKMSHYNSLCMIAGGSGITPMYQMIMHILRNDDDQTKLYLIFANQTKQDILLRECLDELASKYSNRFKCCYTIDRPPQDWKHCVGFINEDMIREHLAAPSDDVLVAMCGPPPMIKFACEPSLDKLLYSPQHRFVF